VIFVSELNIHLMSMAVAAIFAVAALGLAYSFGFFTSLSKQPIPFISWKNCFSVFFVFFILQFFIAPLLALLLIYKKGLMLKTNLELLGWLNVGSVLVVMILLGLFLIWFKKDALRTLFNSKHPLHDILLGCITWCIAFPAVLVLSILMQILLGDYLGFALEDQIAVRQIKGILEYPMLLYSTVGMVVLLIPVIEETLFRGFLQTALKGYFSPLASIVICSLVFAFFHFSLSQGVNNFNILGSLFFLSLFLGFLRERQGNLLSSIALHSAFNAISIVMLLS
jgi:uncharacterized protein